MYCKINYDHTYWTGQCDSKMFTCENSTITVSFKKCGSGCEVISIGQDIEVKVHVTNFTECEAIIKIETNMSPRDPTVSSKMYTSIYTTAATTSSTKTQAQSYQCVITGCIAGLGALVGLLVIPVVLMAIALVWTCHNMKIRGIIIEQLNAR